MIKKLYRISRDGSSKRSGKAIDHVLSSWELEKIEEHEEYISDHLLVVGGWRRDGICDETEARTRIPNRRSCSWYLKQLLGFDNPTI